MEIRYTDDYEEALQLRDAGYEPIECAFGGHGSVLGPLAMDHHGTESHREGVAIRSCRDHLGVRAQDPRFVVTGTPDADAILSILALSGNLSPSDLPPGFPELVDRHDRNPIGMDLTREEHGTLLLAFNQVTLPRKLPGFQQGLEEMAALLQHGVDEEKCRRVLGMERSRMQRAHDSVLLVLGPDGLQRPLAPMEGLAEEPAVVVAHGSVWGFDVWYTYGPLVVSFSDRLKKVTIGCAGTEHAERLFGPGGLLNLYPGLGKGWGGREAIGGSPRGVALSLEDAMDTAKALSGKLPGPPRER